MGHHISIVFFQPNFMWRKNVCLLKRYWSSTLKAESIRTSLQRLDIGILSFSAHESCVCCFFLSIYSKVVTNGQLGAKTQLFYNRESNAIEIFSASRFIE